jgi:molybdate transport system substrate-binding protein
MKFQTLYFLFFIILIACQNKPSEKLTIAVAANMQSAAEDLKKAFKSETGIDCDLIIGSSGKLTAQIMNGAPYDVFLAADMNYPQALFEANRTLTKPTVYAIGKLVLYSCKEDVKPSLDNLTNPAIKHIAISNPKTAPYGKAAKEVLINLGLFEQVEYKLVYGESISQTNQFIESKAAELGFTSLSTVLNRAKTGSWSVVLDSLYTPIYQGIALIKQTEIQNKKSEQFRDFLFSNNGKNILKKHGYSV